MPLLEKLLQQIDAEGPITVAEYMSACLLDPEFGYYNRREPFGVKGDFTTSPEISQMFGELVGLWCFEQWRRCGSPGDAIVLELGPGRGTLMADALRAIESATGEPQPFAVFLLEASETLRHKQRASLSNRSVTWLDQLEQLPQDAPVFVIANEFLDAIPVRQFVATTKGWRERMVTAHDNRLGWAVGESRGCVVHGVAECTSFGSIAEFSPDRDQLVRKLATQIGRTGGALLIVDFTAPDMPLGDSLQAVQAHGYFDRLAAPGECDLASAVDFCALRKAAEVAGVEVYGPVSQQHFLTSIGIAERTATLTSSGAHGAVQEHARLVSPDGMGEEFQVLSVVPAGHGVPDGFAGCTR